jgi:hypothetical protein
MLEHIGEIARVIDMAIIHHSTHSIRKGPPIDRAAPF